MLYIRRTAVNENNGNGEKKHQGKIAESAVIQIAVRDPRKPINELGSGLFEVPVGSQINIPVVFDYMNFRPPYWDHDAWWHYDKKNNTVHVMIDDELRKKFIDMKQKTKEGKNLTKDEQNELDLCEITFGTMPFEAARRAINTYGDYIFKALNNADKANDTNKYRTKRKTKDVAEDLPSRLAVITNAQYNAGLSLTQTGGAYLYPIASTDGLRYDGETLFFKGLPTSEATLKEINKNKDVSIDTIDLPLLRMFYSIILSDFEANSKQLGIVNETVKVYVPDLAALLGKGRNISKNDIKAIIDKTSSFQTIYGIFKDPQKTNGIGTAMPLLVWLGYDENENTIKFASPYMTELIKRIYNVSIRRDENGTPLLKKDGFPQLNASHSYLIKSSIVKERNKRAVEIVMIVVTTIEQAGSFKPHIKARTIIERNQQLKDALDKTETVSNKNILLKRAFSKAWELLDTQTTLREKYPTIKLPDPKNPKDIPTMATLDMVFNFPHPSRRKEEKSD